MKASILLLMILGMIAINVVTGGPIEDPKQEASSENIDKNATISDIDVHSRRKRSIDGYYLTARNGLCSDSTVDTVVDGEGDCKKSVEENTFWDAPYATFQLAEAQPDWPKGCYLDIETAGVYFNTHSDGSRHNDARQICKSKDFTRLDKKKCTGDYIQAFTTFEAAKAACSKNIECGCITVPFCNYGNHITTWKGSGVASDEDHHDCAWSREECKHNWECQEGEICSNGKCIEGNGGSATTTSTALVHTEKGTTCSDSGLQDLSTAQECSDAVNYAKSFNGGKAQFYGTGSFSMYHKGCYIYDDGTMWFNEHSSGNNKANMRSICHEEPVVSKPVHPDKVICNDNLSTSNEQEIAANRKSECKDCGTSKSKCDSSQCILDEGWIWNSCVAKNG